jgi:heme-degrading monooxygenase HmoA
MYCVAWTYTMPPGLSADQIEALFARTADIYLGVPGLVRKYFGHSDDLARVVGIYLWETKEAADAFYSPEWFAGVTSRWGSMPDKAQWCIPQVVESAEGRVVRDPPPRLAAE